MLFAACGGYDREEWIVDLQEGGQINEETSICIVDALEEQLGEDKLGGRASSLSDEDEAVMLEVSTKCILGG